MITINGKPLAPTMFPDNTSQVWKVSTLDIPDTNWVHIVWEYSHEGEFMQLAQLKDLCDQLGFRAALRIKYLPYARQDKEITNQSTFALRTFARLLNSLHFEEVIIIDPHSELALSLIKNSTAKYPIEQLRKVAELLDANVVCYPDKGAVSKYTKIYDYVYVYGNKVRDQLTGHITSYELYGDHRHTDFYGKKVLIVDDICDGGATFVMLAKALREAGATEVNLFVTHGIFSKGLRVLKDAGINKVFTQDGEASEHQQHITYRRL